MSLFYLCINNKNNPASLECRKFYKAIRDENAERRKLIRIIDESGEDYLYPARNFLKIDLPEKVQRLFNLQMRVASRNNAKATI